VTTNSTAGNNFIYVGKHLSQSHRDDISTALINSESKEDWIERGRQSKLRYYQSHSAPNKGGIIERKERVNKSHFAVTEVLHLHKCNAVHYIHP
jgi:hypothetical protein